MHVQRDQPPPYTPPGQYPHPEGQATVITTAPTVLVPTMIVTQPTYMGSNPELIVCPSCRAQIITRVESTPSVRTHLIAACLCLFIFWPCTCLPYCIGSCNNADHYCPNCNAFVGSYRF